MDYGYLWMTSKDENPYYFFAGGSGGQHVFVVPESKMIVITTAHWDNDRSTKEIMDIVVENLFK